MLYLILKKNLKLGYVIYPYFSLNNSIKSIELLSNELFEKHKMHFSENEIKVIQIILEISEKNLAKYFSKNKKNIKDFFTDLTDEYFINFIKPYIERRQVKIIEKAQEFGITVINQDKLTLNIHENNSVNIIDSDINFNFEKTAEYTKYYITLIVNNKSFSLFNKSYILLSTNPCILLIDNTIFKFKDVDGKKLIPFFTNQFIQIPQKTEIKYYETFVKGIVSQYDIKAIGFDVIVEKPSFVVNLTLEKDLNGKYILVLYYKYDENIFRPSDNHTCFVEFNVKTEHNENKFSFTKKLRNTEQEKNVLNYIESLGLIVNREGVCVLPNEKILEDYNNDFISWINLNYSFLQKNGIEIIQKLHQKQYCLGNINIEFKTELSNDWFDIHSVVTFGDVKIPFSSLRNNILQNKKELKLEDGTYVVIPDEWFSRYYDLMSFSNANAEKLKLSKAFFQVVKDISQNNLKEEIRTYDELVIVKADKSIEIPELSGFQLRDYQKIGYYWLTLLKKNNFGGCLADDMGLGKTIQTIAVLKNDINDKKQSIKKSEDQKTIKPFQLNLFEEISPKECIHYQSIPNLIICPTSIIFNWENEFKKFAPEIKVLIYSGIHRSYLLFNNYDVVLTTYGIVRQDIEQLSALKFNYIILDESQNIKNSDSKTFQAVILLNSEYKLALSGTPIENSITDLWSQFQFINPGMFGDKNNFIKEYNESVNEQNVQKIERLKNIIRPFILRRTKDEVEKDLPEHTRQLIYCDMTEEQSELYEIEKSKARNAIIEAELTNNKSELFKVTFHAISKLRQLANHPFMINNEYCFSSGKFEEICSRIQILISEGHKVLVFSSYVKHLNIFATFLNDSNISYLSFTGKHNQNSRIEIVNNFQNNNDIKILLISLKAGGVGLNLTAASYVFVLDPWWNPASEEQAISRAHRIGQKNKVISLKFISKNTIEEKIHNLQQQKSNIADIFINSNNNPFKLNSKEILSIF